jgi:hypothetical protein
MPEVWAYLNDQFGTTLPEIPEIVDSPEDNPLFEEMLKLFSGDVSRSWRTRNGLGDADPTPADRTSEAVQPFVLMAVQAVIMKIAGLY